MSESIEAPSVSPLTTRLGGEPQQKRKYTRKPKVSVTPLTTDVEREPNPIEVSSSDDDKPVEVVGCATPPSYGAEPITPKKRQYKKKEKKVEEPIVEEILYVPEAPHLVRQTNEPEEVSSSSDDEKKVVKEKKPRTEKQQEAFRKMREARLKKTEELKKLKELEKEQKQLEKEQSKLNTITEKVVEKATELKQRKAKPIHKPRAESPEPQYVQIIQEKTNKPYIFV